MPAQLSPTVKPPLASLRGHARAGAGRRAAAEIVVFSAIGTNFLTWANAFEITRLLVEVGLLAVAMTPVIVTGGIDLSVGSLMGLSAVLFGMLLHDRRLADSGGSGWHAVRRRRGGRPQCTVDHAAAVAAADCDAGHVFAVSRVGRRLHARRRQLTRSFPNRFCFWGKAILLGGVPTQLPIFVVVAIGFWILLQRTTIGRGLYAIGFSAEGARYAGIPVERRLSLVYVLSGLMASLAAIIYVAHLGQAKSDAGTGYELDAITAVVLGRHVDLRRARHDPGHGAGTVGDHGAARMVCSWPTCPDIWPAS